MAFSSIIYIGLNNFDGVYKVIVRLVIIIQRISFRKDKIHGRKITLN